MGQTKAILGWPENYVGDHGVALGIDQFGASAPVETLYREFGMTAERVVTVVETLLTGRD